MKQHIHIQAEFDVEFSGDAREHPALTAIVNAVMAQDNGGISASVTDIGDTSVTRFWSRQDIGGSNDGD